MSLDTPWALPITALAEATRAGRLSPVDLLDAYLDRIAALDGRYHAYVHLSQAARQAAEDAQREIAAGGWRGPLHGIPIAVKDNYTTADMPTRAGSALADADHPLRDGAAVARLRAAGAVLIGKTRMHEFAWGMETPPARNPWDDARTPGGSSGGSGAAVAAGLAAAALGSDTGGSIRIPAALCGAVGLKPTFGLIGRSGIIPHSWSLDTAGPLASSVADAAILVAAMAGPDSDDPAASGRTCDDFEAALAAGAGGMRVGVCRNHFFEALQPDVEAAVERQIERLAAAGADIVEFEIAELAHGLGAIFAIELSSSTAYHAGRIEAGTTAQMQPDVQLLVEMGRLVTGPDYIQAERFRRRLCERFAEAFEAVDVVVGPTTPLTAWRSGETSVELGGRTESALAASWRFTYPWNLIGAPAISIPCDLDRQGLPIGLQIAGAPFDEASVIRCAAALEAANGFPPRAPAA
ncbi:aspartyl-tRNA(Asn)/glutamyl-tRNA(Gln) amidotransferase subunit A [Tepidamorphus gemmatus]|uniref:Indoleacetamide hydrolase n=1 Tax=Tepidamorphus gemmatus TaxID=747076 RepID=A0A4R3LRA6_9HYPH|nr:amidase [Tepidamorphus gemmatus]TCT03022.1 aspartyl-tRNA(Asn)/glutamyl-tRNA(Gln) amidotransferase subunit A [Tepidamorphus gemmatus]